MTRNWPPKAPGMEKVRGWYYADEPGFAQFLRGPHVAGISRNAAASAAAQVRAQIPVKHGRLKASVRSAVALVEVPAKKKRGPRWVGVVTMSGRYAPAIEFGTRRASRRGQRVMRDVARAMDGR